MSDHCKCGDDGKCIQCWRPLKCHVTRMCPQGSAAVGKPGLGDYVEKALTAVGITKERVEKITGKPCGCGKRQEALNRLGRKLTG